LLGGLSVSAPACQASNLRVVSTRPGAYHGQTVLAITLDDSGTSACTLDGLPTATGVSPSGATVPFQEPTATGTNSVPLNPGDQASVWLSALGSCTQPSPDTSLASARISIPGGGALTISAPELSISCGGLEVSQFMAVPDYSPAPTGPWSGLRACLTYRPSISVGSSFDYSVTLKNTTDSAVSLDPCPSYSEAISTPTSTAVPTVASASYQLNCSPGDIPAHSSVTFAMQLAVPASAPQGEAKFLWFMNDGPAAGGVIAVT
jgi:hypothetical protein